MTPGVLPSTTGGWRAYFDRHEQMSPSAVGTVRLRDGRSTRALVRSLRRFQAGESSGTRLADEALDPRHAFLDDDSRAALAAFMAEEHRHGELLAALLGGLGSAPATRDLSTRAFVATRRVFGFRAKLTVLMVAEIVGIAFYETVAEAVDEPTVRRVMWSIFDDEVAHLEFGTLLLRRAIAAPGRPFSGRARRVALLTWLRVVLAAALVGVAVDHHPLMRRVGFSTVLRRALRMQRAMAVELSPVGSRRLVVAI